MELIQLLDREAENINQILRRKLNEIDTDIELAQIVDYSVLSRGKRIRPILLKKTFDMFSGEDSVSEEVLENMMTALELVHCYSLVHDDLPCMDNSDYRSGLLTVHKKYSEGSAVLAGDALLNTAMEFAMEAILKEGSNRNTLKAVQILFQKSGINGMIRGQFIDLDGSKCPEISTLMELTDLKTCALIEASMMMGACLAGCEDQVIQRTELLGKHLGMIFQIQDDILDYEEDLNENKLSFATFLGIQKCEDYKKDYRMKALTLLFELGERNPFFTDFIDYLCNRKK